MATTSKYSEYTKEQLIAKIKDLEKYRYGLVWEDKQEEVAEMCNKFLPVLHEVPEKEIKAKENSPQHILVEGDNYHALYVLNFTHKKKVDLIYIDPPYNTGKEKEWKYNDNWVDKNDRYRHTHWLSFINKRLRLAKQLLKETGVILISIDDNEIAQLKMLCDKIFLENNILAVLIWDLGTGTSAGHFTRSHEYILCYAKNKNMFPNFSGGKGLIDDRAVKKISVKNPESEFLFPKGTRFDAEDGFELQNSWGGNEKISLISGRMLCKKGKLANAVVLKAGWTQKDQMTSFFTGEETFDSKGQKVLEFYFRSNGKPYCIKSRERINPPTVLRQIASTKTGSTELASVLGKKDTFNFPKSTALLKYLIQLLPKESIILDYFAGSGTTGHAVLELNKEDGGNRQFILCTNNENDICEDVCYPRIKKVIKGYNGNKGIPANLKYFKTDFVPQVITDNDKRVLVSRSTELLCLAENTFELVKQSKHKQEFSIFKSSSKFTAIIYDEDAIDKCKEALQSINPEFKTVIYVFSYSHEYNVEDFEDLTIRFEVKPIPEAILNVYRKNAKLRRK